MEKRLVDELQASIEGLAATLGQSVAIDTPDGELIAVTRDYGDADPYRINLLLQRRMPEEARTYFWERMQESTPDRPSYVPRNAALSIEARWCYNLGNGMAYLWLLDQGAAPDAAIIDRYAERIVAALAERSIVEPVDQRNRRRARIERAVLGTDDGAHDPAPSDPMDGAVEPVDQGAALTVVCVAVSGDGAPDHAERTLSTVVRIAKIFGFSAVASVEDHGRLVSVLDYPDQASRSYDAAITDLLSAANREVHSGTVGVALSRADEPLRCRYARAAVAHTLGSELCADDALVLWEQIASFAVDVPPEAPAPGGERLARFIGLLRAPEGYAFETTAALFHAHHGEGAAAILQVHRTTILYRQRQIKQLTGIDLTHGPDRHLAFSAWLTELCRRRIGDDLRAALRP